MSIRSSSTSTSWGSSDGGEPWWGSSFSKICSEMKGKDYATHWMNNSQTWRPLSLDSGKILRSGKANKRKRRPETWFSSALKRLSVRKIRLSKPTRCSHLKPLWKVQSSAPWRRRLSKRSPTFEKASSLKTSTSSSSRRKRTRSRSSAVWATRPLSRRGYPFWPRTTIKPCLIGLALACIRNCWPASTSKTLRSLTRSLRWKIQNRQDSSRSSHCLRGCRPWSRARKKALIDKQLLTVRTIIYSCLITVEKLSQALKVTTDPGQASLYRR